MQDREGFVWISTRDGVNRFNGYEFEVFKHDPANKNSLSANTVWMTYQTTDGRIWMATLGGGLSIYNPENGMFNNYLADPKNPHSLSSNTVTNVYQDSKERIWIGTEEGGLNKVIGNPSDSTLKFKSYQTSRDDPNSISNDTIMDIEEDHLGNLWIATYGGGINKFEPESGTFISDFQISGNHAMSLAIDEQNIWVATKYNGLNLVDMSTPEPGVTVFRYDSNDPTSLSADFVWPIFKDSKGQIWVGTFGGGLDKVYKDTTGSEASYKFINYQNNRNLQGSLSGNRIHTIFEDKNGLLWVGTDNNGFATFLRQDFFKYPNINLSNGLSTDDITLDDIIVDSKGNQWLATTSGVIKIDKAETSTVIGEEREIQVNTVLEDSSGQIIFGTNLGLYMISNVYAGTLAKIPVVSANKEEDIDRVFDIVQDRKGFFWVSTNNGLWKLSPEFKVINRFYNNSRSFNSLSANNIGNLLIEEDTLWVATSTAGFNKVSISTGKVTQFSAQGVDSSSLSNNKTKNFLRDSNNNLWITTYGGGINKLMYKNGKPFFKYYFKEDGLPDNTVNSIAMDSQNRIWVTTQKGLARLNPKEDNFVPLTIPEGYSNNNINELIALNDSLFVLIGNKGYRHFVPGSFTPAKSSSSIKLSEISVMNKAYQPSNRYYKLNRLELPHYQNFIAFEFSLLDYAAPNQNTYRYKMEGVDQNWVNAGNRRFVNYTDLAPGNYTFKVKASNYAGMESDEVFTFPLVIHTPYWATWWFRGLMVCLAGAMLFIAYQYRIKMLMKVETTRRRIAGDLHDEISATLSSITFFAEGIRRSQSELKDYHFVDLISESASDAKDKITDIIWSINPEQGGWPELLAKCRRFASDLFESKDIDYGLDIDQNIPGPLPLKLRKNSWLIFKELVTNAARHSQAEFIQISMQYVKGCLLLEIKDNGKGFDPNQQTKGNGLQNLRMRSREVNAEIDLQTSPGKGTYWKWKVEL